jgi:hypothetical protein
VRQKQLSAWVTANLVAIAVLDICSCVAISLGNSALIPPVLLASLLIGMAMGGTNLNRVLSLGLGAAVVACTSAGIAFSYWLGNGIMSQEVMLGLRNYFAHHCMAIIAGHLFAIVLAQVAPRGSNARVVRRTL